jgi:hypothetical protein
LLRSRGWVATDVVSSDPLDRKSERRLAMQRWKLVAGVTAIALTALLAGAWTLGGNTALADEPSASPLPKPGPEHEILKKEAGVWDASVETTTPDGKTDVSKGLETNTLMAGGLWLITDYKGKFGGQPFEGHGIMGYDPHKKKYIGSWADSMSAGLSTMEETYDASKKTMSGWMEGPDENGKPMKMNAATVWKDDNTRVFTMAMTGPDGKEVTFMKITYTRRSK